MKNSYLKSITGCLLGTAVGDALGLPYKKLSRNRIYQAHTPIKGHAFIFNKGMISDDTEHLCLTAQALIVSAGDPQKFSQKLAWGLRWWVLGLPVGISLATLKACMRLLIGFSAQDSGVNSAGNGAAMRSTIIGVCYGDNPSTMLALVKASTIITHRNPKAELGAIAVAVAAYLASIQSTVTPQDYYQTLKKFLSDSAAKLPQIETTAFLTAIDCACTSTAKNESGVNFANQLGNYQGVSGYIYDTVCITIQVWLRNQNSYSQSIKEIIYLGGDTDTTAAILGGIVGASVGVSGIPQKWLKDMIEFPHSTNWIASLAERLAESCNVSSSRSPLPFAFYFIPLRNFVFGIAFLFHAFYRLLPPY